MIREEQYFRDQLNCRICFSTDLACFLDLGVTELADRFISDLQPLSDRLEFPLSVNSCSNCGWIQLSITVSTELMYANDYPYDSRTTVTGQKHWMELALKAVGFIIKQGQIINVLDIGSNTGALLSEFQRIGCKVLGIDPATQASKIAKSYGIDNYVGFFGESALEYLNQIGFKPDIITATNSFAHTDDLHDWLSNVSKILSGDGLLIIEVPHALELILHNQFDTIYHEHLSYVTLTPLIPLFKKYGLNIFKVEKMKLHGGSIRIYCAKKYYDVDPSVNDIIYEEALAKVFESQTLIEFSKRVQNTRTAVREFIIEKLGKGFKIGLVSAPAKGITFYSYCSLRDFNFLGISDKNPLKIGKIAPGSQVRVMSDKELISLQPDYLFILAWNFKDEIVKNLRKLGYKDKFIVGIPALEVIDA